MLHPLAQDALLRITADYDRETLFEFYRIFHDRINELHQVAGRETRRPIGQDEIDRLDAPLIVGGAAFRRPSVSAMQWLADYASPWWGDKKRAWTFALAYACAHRNKTSFDMLFSRARASVICWRFALAIPASEETIRRAALALLPPEDDSIKWLCPPEETEFYDDPRADLQGLALALSNHYGGTPDHWLWETADADFWGAVAMMRDEKEAESDPKHEDPESWWRRHRRAVVACETKLEVDAEAWAAKRKKRAEAGDG